MTGVAEARLRRLALVAIGASLALGVLVGLILGWRVWPVIWYNTDPSDLRVEHQMAYVMMVADSLQVTGDVDSARARLHELLDEDTTWEQVANLVERVSQEREEGGDQAGALRVRRLALDSGMPTPARAEFDLPRRRIPASGRLLAYLLGVAVVILLLAAVAMLLSMRTRTRFVRRGAGRAPFRGGQARPSELHSPVRLRSPGEHEPAESLGGAAAGEDAGADEPLGGPIAGPPWEEPVPPEEIPLESEPGREEALEEEPGAGPRSPDTGPLGVFEAKYVLGDDDFDCSFGLESPDGEFLGECGLGITDVLGSGEPQRVDAFEVWLFDKGDIRTVSKVLVSEHVYQDEALNARLSAKGELVEAQPGLTITLETPSLRVSATIADFAYVEDDLLPNSCFSHLEVEMIAEQNDAAL